MALVGSGCEKAKHHLNPSPKRPKTLRNRKQKTGETLPTEPSKDKDKNGSRRQWMRKGQTPPKSKPKTTKKLRNRKQKTGETLPTEPSKDKDKNVALVGSGCEKAKHHLNPSPKRPKTLRNRKQKTGETLPTEPSKDKDKNGSRRQCTTNLQAAGKTCPKTSWAFKKPANSTKLLGALPVSEGSADIRTLRTSTGYYLTALLWNQITATAEAQMEQSAEQDDGRAIASMVGCFKNTCGMLSWYPNVSHMFQWSFRWNVLSQILGQRPVPCRMSPVKRAEVHPSRLGCPSLFFSFRIPELAKDP